MSASISLSIAGQQEPILCTGNHPFWSEERHDFVRADSLQPNETLRTTSGSTTVTSLTHIPGSTTVYNLEIHGTHVYHVGSSGVLVHNWVGLPCTIGFDSQRVLDALKRAKERLQSLTFDGGKQAISSGKGFGARFLGGARANSDLDIIIFKNPKLSGKQFQRVKDSLESIKREFQSNSGGMRLHLVTNWDQMEFIGITIQDLLSKGFVTLW